MLTLRDAPHSPSDNSRLDPGHRRLERDLVLCRSPSPARRRAFSVSEEERLSPIVHRKRAYAPVLSCRGETLQLDDLRPKSPARQETGKRQAEPARSKQ